MDMDDVTALFDTNLFGVMRMVKEFVHPLIASGDGRIVNIGKSIVSIRLVHCLLNFAHLFINR